MRIFFFCALLLLTGSRLMAADLADNSLKGTVRDNSGRPLEGVIVELPDLKVGTATDSMGHYEINNLPKGKFVVVATLISFAKATATVTIDGEAHYDFTLTESAIESHEVVITGQSKATEIKRNPTPVEVVDSKYLHSGISTNIINAIANVPGVAEVSTGPNVSKPVIRGLGYNRVLTLYNGMRQEGQQWGDEHGVEADEYNIDRVELVKGPASLIYGSDAIAGVVNLIPAQHAPEGKTIGEVLTEYQSNNNLIGASGMLTGNKSGFYWLARISHKQAMDYQSPVDGRVYATNYNETNASGSLGVNKKWGYSHLDIGISDDLQAVPDGSRDSLSRRFTKQVSEADTFRPVVPNSGLNSYNIPVLHQHVQHYRFLSTNSFNVLNGFLIVNAGFERNVRREFSHPEQPSLAGLFLELNTYTYDVKYHVKSIKGWDVTGGINGMYQVNDVTKGTEFIIPSYKQLDFGPFLVFQKTIGKCNIAGGIRFDSRSFHNDQLTADTTIMFRKYDHTFSGITYSLGLAYLVSKQVALKVNLARGYRAPNILEISANGEHPGTGIYQLGNNNFKPEFSLQEDIGMEFTSQHLSINVSVFNNDISNYIFNRKLPGAAGYDSLINGYMVYQFRQSGARLYGGEASIDIHPHPLDWLHFENSISVVYAMNNDHVNDSSKFLPFIPPVHIISELRTDFKRPAKWLKNSFVKLQSVIYLQQDRVYLVDNTETPTPAYMLINAGIGSDITSRKGKVLFNLALFGDNLFDVAYQDHLSRLKYFEPYPNDPRGRHGIYNMGRNVGIKLSVPFSI